MADRRRKSLEGTKPLHAHVSLDSWLFINEAAGEFGQGEAIDRIIRELRLRRAAAAEDPIKIVSCTKSVQ